MLGIALVSALVFTSCENDFYRQNYDAAMNEQLMYKKAYEELQRLKANGQNQVINTPVVNTPVTNITVTPIQTYNDRVETLTVVGTGTILTYNVVCGSFTNKTNALNLQKTLISKGYNSILATNEKGMFRVIASTFGDRASAVTSRDKLRATYPDAWLLINKK